LDSLEAKRLEFLLNKYKESNDELQNRKINRYEQESDEDNNGRTCKNLLLIIPSEKSDNLFI
jgi:hypothetical protein